MRFGFQDEQDIPEMLAHANGMSDELDIDPDDGVLLPVARDRSSAGATPGMMTWRKRLFIGLAHNAANPGRVLPPARRPHGRDGLAASSSDFIASALR